MRTQLIDFLLIMLFHLTNSLYSNSDEKIVKPSIQQTNNELENKLNDLLFYYKNLIKVSNKEVDPDLTQRNYDKTLDLYHKGKINFDKISNLLQIENSSAPSVDHPFVWKKYPTTSTPPTSRRGHSTTIVDNYMIVFGGCYMETRCFNDLYFFDMG